MITTAEIDAKADELDVHVANIQRDYIFGWLLKEIFSDNYLASVLVLKGGNCFRKAYFPEARYSDDLDFSTSQILTKEKLMSSLALCCERIEKLSGVRFSSERNSIKEESLIDLGVQARQRIYKVRLYFNSFHDEVEVISIAVRLDISEFDKIYLPVKKRQLIHPYSDAQDCVGEIKCLALEEMVANKMKCLLQRRHSHDLFDMVYAYLIKGDHSLDRMQVISTFLRKTIFQPSPRAAKELLLRLPMDYFRQAWGRYIVSPITSRFEFDLSKDKYLSIIEELFTDSSSHRTAMNAFFPAEYRNPIMDAARENKLLRLTYGGVARLVEPYALTFKRTKDQVAQEYFYCWDRTGGASSGPGVKTLLHSKITDIEITEQLFEPRYEIELSKAGEMPQQPYFSRNVTNRAGTIMRSSAKKRSSPSLKFYTVQCPYCQKRFKRSTVNLKLNPHKTSDGFACAARTGYLV